MATNQELVDKALAKIGFSGNIEASNISETFAELQDILGEMYGNGLDLSYDFDSTITDETGIDRAYWSAITSILAFRRSESLGIQVSDKLALQASAGAQTIMKGVSPITPWKHPNRMPIGSGNSKRGVIQRYYNESDETVDVLGLGTTGGTIVLGVS